MSFVYFLVFFVVKKEPQRTQGSTQRTQGRLHLLVIQKLSCYSGSKQKEILEEDHIGEYKNEKPCRNRAPLTIALRYEKVNIVIENTYRR